MRLNPLFLLSAALAALLAAAAPVRGQADACELRDKYNRAAADAEAAHEAYRTAAEPARIAQAMSRALELFGIDNLVALAERGGDWDDVVMVDALVHKYTNEGEPPELTGITGQLKAWLEARKKRDAAAATLAAAEDEYRKVILEGDAALVEAQKAFDAEQAWLTEQRSKLPTGEGSEEARLRESLRMSQHAKATYEKLKADLDRFRCLGLVAPFLADLDNRLARIDRVIERVTEKLGGAGAGGMAGAGGDAQPPKDEQGQPLGDEYVLVGPPEIKHGAQCSADGKSISFTMEVDGNTESGKITVEGIPTSVRVGQRVELTITATGTAKSYATGQLMLQNCYDARAQGETSVGTWPGFRAGDHANGKFTFIFLVGQYEPMIGFYGGRYNNDPRSANVLYRYKKAGT